MNLAEIIKKIIEAAKNDGEFDAEKALNAFVADKMEGLQNKNTEILGKLKEAKKVADGLPEDFSIEKWNEMVKALDGVDLSKLSTPEQVEAVKANLTEAHQKEIEQLKTREGTLHGALQKSLVDSVVASAVSKAHGNATLLSPHIAQQVKMVEEDGEFRAVVIGPNGAERFSVEKAGERMSIDELVGEFKGNDTYAAAFGAGNGGGGGGGGGDGGGRPNPWKKGPDYSLTEQSRIMNTEPDVAKSLQAAAEAADTGAAA